MISIENLKGRFKYEPETGKIFDVLGNEKFLVSHSKGYFVGGIDYKVYKAHRVAWALHYGSWPDGFIDHINGDRKDNRISNLRLATRGQNRQNSKMNENNTTGYKCVHLKSSGRFEVQVSAGGVRRYFGTYSTAEEAHSVYLREMKKLHGEYGRSK